MISSMTPAVMWAGGILIFSCDVPSIISELTLIIITNIITIIFNNLIIIMDNISIICDSVRRLDNI